MHFRKISTLLRPLQIKLKLFCKFCIPAVTTFERLVIVVMVVVFVVVVAVVVVVVVVVVVAALVVVVGIGEIFT